MQLNFSKVEMRLDPPFSEIEDGDVGDRGAGFKTAENGHVLSFLFTNEITPEIAIDFGLG